MPVAARASQSVGADGRRQESSAASILQVWEGVRAVVLLVQTDDQIKDCPIDVPKHRTRNGREKEETRGDRWLYSIIGQ